MKQGSGLCLCGCGQKTSIPGHSDKTKGWTKGEPLKFIKGHNLRVYSATVVSQAIGNKSVAPNGYVRVNTTSGREYEHILAAEKALGRKLKWFGKNGHPKNEVVHHIDGNKTNNKNSNLMICTHAYHTSLHHRLEKSESWPQFPKILRNVK